jgi:hypothetical protein
MRIDPKIERPAREMIGHSMRNELDQLSALIQAEGDKTLLGTLLLCMAACGYIAIDVTGMRWPSEAMLRKIAHNASTAATGLDLNEDDIFAYLSRNVFGAEPLEDLFEKEAVGFLPLLITANLLATFRPKELHWWEYLDQIWDAHNAADQIDKKVLPALMFQVRKDIGRPQGD